MLTWALTDGDVDPEKRALRFIELVRAIRLTCAAVEEACAELRGTRAPLLSDRLLPGGMRHALSQRRAVAVAAEVGLEVGHIRRALRRIARSRRFGGRRIATRDGDNYSESITNR